MLRKVGDFMGIDVKTFINVISKLEKVQNSIIYLDMEHRDLMIIRLGLLNEKLAEYGISVEELKEIDQTSELEAKRSKNETFLARKEEQVKLIKKEIILSNRAIAGKKGQRQQKIQTDRLDRNFNETKDDF